MVLFIHPTGLSDDQQAARRFAVKRKSSGGLHPDRFSQAIKFEFAAFCDTENNRKGIERF